MRRLGASFAVTRKARETRYPGTQTTSSPQVKTGTVSRRASGTLASTNTSWSFFEPLSPVGKRRSPGLRERTVRGRPLSAPASMAQAAG